ncbi:hypothetical protein ACE7GA_00960 [Roseomonas sp. CCTCC AB2023176]|uniref:hypothetical protein n=1 Tax=Roseomonas sp. CCTCC AB2023176 TaxID=3342640 RepID=UPI0035E24CD6
MSQGVPFEPTEEQRRTVRAMSGYGVPQDDIATLLEVSPKTLRKHFGRELERGSIEATAKVGQSLFRMATEGGSVAAAIFWMKARAGWREKQAPGGSEDAAGAIDAADVRGRIAGRLAGLARPLPDDPHEAARVYRQVIEGRAE